MSLIAKGGSPMLIPVRPEVLIEITHTDLKERSAVMIFGFLGVMLV